MQAQQVYQQPTGAQQGYAPQQGYQQPTGAQQGYASQPVYGQQPVVVS